MALLSLNRLSALGLSELNTFPCLLVTVKRTDVAFREVFNCLFELSGIVHTSTRQIDMNVLVLLLKRHYKTRTHTGITLHRTIRFKERIQCIGPSEFTGPRESVNVIPNWEECITGNYSSRLRS